MTCRQAAAGAKSSALDRSRGDIRGQKGRQLMSQKILVAQGGGPTAVINQSLVGVALEARRFADIAAVYGARHGVRGIVNEDLVDLGQESVANLEAVAATPAAALGSTRDQPDRKYCQEI